MATYGAEADSASSRSRSADQLSKSSAAPSVALLLIITGYALYYTTGTGHDAAALAHEAIGVLALAAALAHWWRNRPRA